MVPTERLERIAALRVADPRNPPPNYHNGVTPPQTGFARLFFLSKFLVLGGHLCDGELHDRLTRAMPAA
jgi:hypothetical protein